MHCAALTWRDDVDWRDTNDFQALLLFNAPEELNRPLRYALSTSVIVALDSVNDLHVNNNGI